MKIEHIALNVREPDLMAAWYMEALGLQMAREILEPMYTAFLADDDGQTVLELYNNQSAEYPPFADMSVYSFHIAMLVDDISAEIARLEKAGGTIAAPAEDRPNGDRLGFIRDPWGVTIQLVERTSPLIA